MPLTHLIPEKKLGSANGLPSYTSQLNREHQINQ